MKGARRLRGARATARVLVDWATTRRLRIPTEWRIGILRGASPLDLHPAVDGPVLTAADVDDAAADFIADPLMVLVDDTWWMFFEVLNRATGRGEIGCARSADASTWDYQGLVLRQPHHLSYPFVFTYDDTVLMVPEEGETQRITLYRADEFPRRWQPVAIIAEGAPFEDTTVFEADGVWWAVASITDDTATDLIWYTASEPLDEWRVYRRDRLDGRIGRPGGRPWMLDGRMHRFGQDSTHIYGESLSVFRTLSSGIGSGEELIAPNLYGPEGRGWRAARMHTIDAHQMPSGEWVACADGRGFPEWVGRAAGWLGAHPEPY